MTYSIIPKSHLEGALRLDPEYYQPEYLEYLNKIRKFNVVNIGEASSVLRGNTPKEYGDFDVPIVRSGDLDSNFFIREDILKTKDENIFYLKRDDVLISSIGFGSIGKVNIFTGNNDTVGTVSEVTVIRDSKVNPFYIWAFLRSKFGQFQINREITGATGQLHLNTGNVENILMPVLKDDKVFEKLFIEAANMFEKSKSLYSQAEYLLLKELGIKDVKQTEDLTFTATLKDCLQAGRIDAEFFQPKFDRIKKAISKTNNVNLREIFSIRRGDFISPDYYVEKSKRGYIRIKELPAKGEIYVDQIAYIKDNFSASKQEELQENDFVFACIGATLGKTGRVTKELEGSFYSNNTARFRLKKEWGNKININYLQILLQSFVCQMQFEQMEAQTAQAKIADNDLEKVIIPILPLKTQQKIADLVNESFKLRKEAKDLLEEAKKRVEEEIERN